MSVASWLGIGKEAKDIGEAFDGLFTSDDERLSRAEMMARIKQKPGELLNALDMVQATSTDMFTKRVRPLAIYIATFNFAGMAVITLAGSFMEIPPALPEAYLDITSTGFLGALGLYGGFRTVEKLNNKTR